MRNLIADLAAIAGPAQVLTAPDAMASYVTDWTRRYTGAAACVVRPGSVGEVAEVVRTCARFGAAIIPQGGNTSLVGGSVPPGGLAAGDQLPVIVSAGRLTGLDEVDRAAAEVTAGAGVTIARLQAHAADAGLRYGVDLASRDSATVGGTIATNAGGIRAIRYGPTRAQVVGLSAVLADGQVLDGVRGTASVTAGYDLAQLLTGSEGTLAVITAARLRLRPAEPAGAVVLAGVSGIAQAVELYGRVRSQRPGLLAAEYFDAAGLDLVLEATGLTPPMRVGWPGYLLVEIAGDGSGFDPASLDDAGLPNDSALAFGRHDQAALWAYRERLTEAIAAAGLPHKIDVSVPGGALGEFRAELDHVVRQAAPGRSNPLVIVFGHLGVGNLHVNVLGPDPASTAVDEAVARLAAGYGGSVAAEHGIGRAKTGWLGWSKSAAEISAMRAIKTALDPTGLLNPGVLVG